MHSCPHHPCLTSFPEGTEPSSSVCRHGTAPVYQLQEGTARVYLYVCPVPSVVSCHSVRAQQMAGECPDESSRAQLCWPWAQPVLLLCAHLWQQRGS